MTVASWMIYHGTGKPRQWTSPPVPPWRVFDGGPPVALPLESDPRFGRRLGERQASAYQANEHEIELVNTALYLRRPLLITGKPGTGKSTLAYAVAHELGLGPVLRWPITSRSSLREGLYQYDAVGRLQEANIGGSPDIGRYIRLGPLGTALLPYDQPRVLLIDELDKSDIDLPNDLLNVFEEGEYEIPELARIADTAPRVDVTITDSTGRVPIEYGRVRCRAFPVVMLTSNGEREFPPPFLRRCIRMELGVPDEQRLASIVEAHLGEEFARASEDIVDQFLDQRRLGDLATDQLLNAIFLTFHAAREEGPSRQRLAELVLRHLSSA